MQRAPVDVGAAIDAGRYLGEPASEPEKAGALNSLNGLSQDEQVESVRRLRTERLSLEAVLRNGVGTGVVDVPRSWVSVTTATVDSASAKRAARCTDSFVTAPM